MLTYEELYQYFFDNVKKLLYPEEWVNLDLAVSKSELLTLLYVDKHGEIIMSQVADFINVPMSTATGIVERLVKNSYLKRDRSETDRRIVTINLTEKGKAIVEKLKSSVGSYLDAIVNSLTDDEKQLLSGIFIKVVNILNEKTEQTAKTNEDNKLKKIQIE